MSSLTVANWGIPLAAIADAKLTPEKISGKMTTGKLILSDCTSCYTRIPRSMPNADQYSGIDPNVDNQTINADQFQLMPINAGSSRTDPALLGID